MADVLLWGDLWGRCRRDHRLLEPFMSDVTRYTFDMAACWHEHPDGEFVEHDAYAKLAAEAQALREERDSQQRVAINAMEELAALRARVVVVPERDARRMDTEYPEGWNDCLDELARLNGKTVSEGLLRGMGAFAQEIISGALEGGKFDGADLQESAERHGLIAKQVMNEPCRGPEEYCACAWSTSFPTECYRITAELRALLNQDKENGNG
ncbi:hypothetical protein HBO42_29310 [Pseudomonas aeruginosa]|nr:hypothetical protein [Pseudomonas aeruginosa]